MVFRACQLAAQKQMKHPTREMFEEAAIWSMDMVAMWQPVCKVSTWEQAAFDLLKRFGMAR